MTADLSDLIARLEAAEAGSREMDGDIHRAIFPEDTLMTDSGSVGPVKREAKREAIGTLTAVPGDVLADCMGVSFYTTSLEAALALLDRVLPGWAWEIRCDRTGSSVQAAPVWWMEGLAAPDEGGVSCDGKTPALALCIAICRAKAQEG